MKLKESFNDNCYCFDIDDTLFTTDAKIIVKSDSEQKLLTPQQYNTYKLKPGEQFDFSQFQDTDILLKTAEKTPYFNVLVKMNDAIKQHRSNSKIYILTARDESIVDGLKQLLSKNGVTKITKIYAVGSWKGNATIAERKKKVISHIRKSHKGEVTFFDDDKKNVELAKQVPGVKARLVKKSIEVNEEVNITMDAVRKKLDSTMDRMDRIPLEVLLDYEGNGSEEYLQFLSNFANKLIKKVKENYNNVFINEGNLAAHLLEAGEMNYNEEELFPIPLYVSATNDKADTIGILVDKDGKFIEIFEGNDEASAQTVKLVNNIMNPKGKLKWLYGSHGKEVVDTINKTMTLPANIYLSPSREYASSYWGEGREPFKVLVNINSLSQESEFDWKTIEETPIEKMELL